jgi:hypothetical protein
MMRPYFGSFAARTSTFSIKDFCASSSDVFAKAAGTVDNKTAKQCFWPVTLPFMYFLDLIPLNDLWELKLSNGNQEDRSLFG